MCQMYLVNHSHVYTLVARFSLGAESDGQKFVKWYCSTHIANIQKEEWINNYLQLHNLLKGTEELKLIFSTFKTGFVTMYI